MVSQDLKSIGSVFKSWKGKKCLQINSYLNEKKSSKKVKLHLKARHSMDLKGILIIRKTYMYIINDINDF